MGMCSCVFNYTCNAISEHIHLFWAFSFYFFFRLTWSFSCMFQTDAYDAAIKSCRMVLDVQPENVKALFRTGKVSVYTGKIQ